MSTITIIPSTKAQQLHLRVAAYCRVSSDSADQLHSYAAQINAYTQLIQQHSDWELVDIYADEGLTGTRMDKRTEFGRLLSDCRKGRVDKILVKSISRFARNTKDCLVVLRELKLLNVSVQFEEEHIDTQTLTSELMVSVFGSLAQQESTSISQNLRMSYQRRMEKGAFSTCKAPFGYRLKDGKQLTIHPPAAESVSWIFSEYLRGRSQAQIAEDLTRRGLSTADGTPYWQETSIAYILTNEKYIGDSLCQKTYTTPLPFAQKRNFGEQPQYYVHGSHPAIISKEVFEQAQQLRRKRIYEKQHCNRLSPFLGKLICGNCGSSFTRRVNANGYTCFVCRNRNKKVTRCSVGRISEVQLQAACIRLYNRLRCNMDTILTPALHQLRALEEALQRDNPALTQLNLEIAETAVQAQKVSKMLSAGLISADICITKQRKIDSTLKELRRKRGKILQNSAVDEAIKTITSLQEILTAGPEQLIRFDTDLFETLVEKITVLPDYTLRFRLYGGITLEQQEETA